MAKSDRQVIDEIEAGRDARDAPGKRARTRTYARVHGAPPRAVATN
jgi:hypothetical protein